jgi:hypothetical protein
MQVTTCLKGTFIETSMFILILRINLFGMLSVFEKAILKGKYGFSPFPPPQLLGL